jgi:dolichyldiphosphatase
VSVEACCDKTTRLIQDTFRYHLMYHSWQQIFVGFSTGILTGAAYYYVTEVLIDRPLFGMRSSLRQAALDNPIFVALRIRDSWAVWDDAGVEGEYGFWRAEWERRKAEDQSIPNESVHLTRMLQALQLASQCEETNAAFCVGCVITASRSSEVLSTGYSRQEPGNTHAEEVALNVLMSKSSHSSTSTVTLDLDLYTTMEPCSERLSKKSPCVQRILEFNEAKYNRKGSVMKIRRIYQGVQEPEDFVKCAGTKMLEQAGLQVITVQGPTDMRRVKTGEQVQLETGWIEREALRLAKRGHDDQKPMRGIESRMWIEDGWICDDDATQPRLNGLKEKKSK